MCHISTVIFVLACIAVPHISAGRLPNNHDLVEPVKAIQPREPRSIDLGSLGSLIPIVKSQFREIFEELCQQALKYLLNEFHLYKLNLLKKLGKYTLSNVFHTVFDGVTDFVITDAEDESSSSAIEAVAEQAEESQRGQLVNYNYVPYEWREAIDPRRTMIRRF